MYSKKTILITSISGQLGLSILKRVKKLDFIKVYGCDINPLSIGANLVDKFISVSHANSELYITELNEIIINYGISYLIVTSEPEILKINSSLTLLENVKVIVNDKKITDIFLDKKQTYSFLESNGFRVPKTYTNLRGLKNGDYIIKFRRSSGSKLVQRFNSASEIFHLINKFGEDNLIIQDYLKDLDEYTATVISDTITTNLIVFKRWITGGLTYRVELIHNSKINSSLMRLSKLLTFKGTINVQFKLFEGDICVFDINPRISGSTGFKYLLGFDEIKWWIEMIDGKNLTKSSILIKKAIGAIDIHREIIYSE